jgi:ParB family transcriptional regulator, chromosome partitioning protein
VVARRSGLGRGLGALIPGSEDGDGSAADQSLVDLRDQAFREVDIESIRPNTYQPRKHLDESELSPLSDSIKEVGVLQPLLVRASASGFELIAGERRWRASKQAGLTTVPVIVKDSDDAGSLEQALVENLHRKDLNPLDEASAYKQLIEDFSMTHDKIAKRVGRSRAAVSNLLRLLQAPPKIQRLVIDGRLSEGHARALLTIEDSAYQSQLAERIAKDGMSVRAVEEAVRMRKEFETQSPIGGTDLGDAGSAAGKANSASSDSSEGASTKGSRSKRTDAAALEWQERIGDALDTKVHVDASGKRGRVVIDFADLDDLDRVGSLIVTSARSKVSS